ncbi:hypothetical protein HK097_010197 [Rhizophlyctis rosea]|uniref:Rad21/Rec8-like protein C-terminal eukaryotic domain-containing protein n=1 Tax=Rhizophlyctis rosea TaxID=64517 RepID=A0AAD5S7W6_9FUNG|nr:hypothetical protein HK097_010197 [Rhizophlyctis rosea]
MPPEQMIKTKSVTDSRFNSDPFDSMGAFGDYAIQDDPLKPPPRAEGAAAGGAGTIEELDLFGDLFTDHDAGRKRKAIQPDGDLGDLANLGAFGDDGFDFQQVDQAVPATPEQALNQREGEGAAPAGGALLAPAKKKRRFRRTVVDTEIELSNHEMANLARTAEAALDQAERAAKIKAKEKKDKELVQKLLTEPSFRLGTKLMALWKANYVEKRRKVHLGMPSAKRQKRDAAGGVAGKSINMDIEMPLHFDGGYDNLQDRGQREGSVDDPEMMRAGGTRKSLATPDMMPWHRPSKGSSGGDSARDTFSNVGDDFQFDVFRGNSSFGGSIDSPLKDLPNIDGPNIDDENPFKDPESASASMEREMSAFLAYVKDIASGAGTDSVQFFDLIPPHTSSRKVATGAFYHLLALSSRNVLRPTQEEPYGDIRITVVDVESD